MKMILSLLILVCSGSSASADAMLDMNPLCISKDRINQFAQHYPLFRSYRGRDLCATDDARVFRVAQALSFMQDIKLSGPNSASGDDLVTPLLGDSWSEYFAQYVTELKLEDSCSSESTLAYMINETSSERTTMHFCPAFFNSAYSSLNTAVTAMMHEAWHLKDNRGTYHVACTRGIYSGNPSKFCDESISSRGAHAISVEVLAKIAARGENVNPVARADARSYMIATTLNLFNQAPSVDRSERPLLLTKDGKLVLLGEDHADVEMENVPHGLLVQRFDHGFADFAPSDTTVQTIGRSLKSMNVIANESVDPLRREYNSMSVKSRANVRAIHYGQVISFILTANGAFAACNRTGNEIDSSYVTQVVKSGRVKLKSVVYPDGLIDSERVQIVSETGLWAEIYCNDDGDVKISKWSKPAIATYGKLIKIGKLLYGLSKEGYLLERSADDTQPRWIRNDAAGDMVFSDFTSYQWIRYLGLM